MNKIKNNLIWKSFLFGLFLLVCFLGFSNTVKAYDSNLVSYFDFNDNKTDLINSSNIFSGNGFSYNSSNPWSFGSPQKSIDIGTYYQSVTNLDLTVSNNFSVSFWGYYQNNISCIQLNNNSDTKIFKVCFDHQNDGRAPNDITFTSNTTVGSWSRNYVGNTGSGYPNISSGWHLLTFTFTSSHINYYRDGSLIFSSDLTSSLNADIIKSITIEGQSWFGTPTYFDDLAIFSSTLSDSEVLSIYNLSSEIGESIITTPPAPTTHDYISPVLTDGNVEVEVCGSAEVCEGDKISNWQVIYDICDSWDYGSTFEIGMENESHTNVNEYLTDPSLFMGPRTADQCRGSFQYREFFSNNIGYENWHFFLRKTTATTTETIYFEDFAFEVAVLPEIIYSNGFILYTGSNPKIVNTSLGAGTSTIPFQFNVCADEEWEDSQFVLENLDTNELLTIATSTDVCAGTDILELPHANKFVNSLNARINLVNASSTNKILGNSFNIIWQLTDKPILETCKMPSYDINDICEDIDTSTMLGDIKCGIKYAIVVSAQFLFYPSCSSLTSISDTYDSFKRAFPFNTFFDFTGSIDEAIDTSLSTTTNTNNISLPFIRQTATSTEYYMLPVMSTTTISNTIGSSGYNTIRTTLEYIYWVIAGFIIFFLIFKK